ncbi:MAG TPA: hypothetical protein PKA53_05745 [Sphingobacterium sp.]|nr:hypothetical protein [Sphingobacterium sp.]
MKKIPLLPRSFKWVGLGLLVLFYLFKYVEIIPEQLISNVPVFAIISNVDGGEWGDGKYFKWIETNLDFTLDLVVSIMGLGFIAFSRLRTEDEMINSIRLYAWSWATILLFAYILLISIFIYGMAFFSFYYLIPHLFILFYLIFFYVDIFKLNRKGSKDEE